MDITLPQAIYWMEPYGVVNNVLGAVSMGVSNNLRELGYEVSYCYSQDTETVAQEAAQADVAVVMYMTTKYAHYVTFRPHSTDPVTGETMFEFFNENAIIGDYRTYEDFKNDPNTAEKFATVVILVNKK